MDPRFRFRSLSITAVTLTCTLLVSPAWAETARNVIVLIPDGQSQSVVKLARLYRDEPLAVDGILSGMVDTTMANSVITGSAAAGTAFATGYRTTEPHIGMAPRPYDVVSTYEPPAGVDWDTWAYRPLATVLEGAALQDKSTGLVATSRITHATPATFAAHVDDRSDEDTIMKHLVHQDLDVVLGGGYRHLLPRDAGGTREDGLDLEEVLQERGYHVVDHAEELAAIHSGRVWGLFDHSHLMADLDRRYLLAHPLDHDPSRVDQARAQPSLADMTAKAIELLSRNPSGFFLLVEGSQVDWAGHDNDVAYALHDFLAFDDAVKVALDYARRDPQTLVIVVPDHNTGAMSIGNWATSGSYTATTPEAVIEPVQGMQMTAGLLLDLLPDNPSDAELQDAVARHWGIPLDANDLAAIRDEEPVRGLKRALIKVVNDRHTVFGWTTHGHTAEDVPLWSFGPGAPRGLMDNTGIAHSVAQVLHLELDVTEPRGLNQRLFVDVQEAFPQARIDASGVQVDGWTLPNGTDLLLGEPGRCELEGITVHVPAADDGAGRTYIPAQAVQILENPALWQRHCQVHRPTPGQRIRDRILDRLQGALPEQAAR
ncbi:alkaline phosphatase [Ectothiorhodospira mobilis]|uniref:Alkaline phosphatase n=1 Tax=Ectothiorhodospira mobilis TaxID=195064 RepID=A0A1I4RWN5_ECTMO|nr:alkaline phosphatase [Ectothiorhodospira mobilis]SFM56647.1 alkaline phosphatase [Ectothiorhodospira mobilis]